MAFTRFRDDPARVHKTLEQMTFAGNYMLDTPGPGVYAPYMADPQIRAQRWAANMWTDTTNLESELIGLGAPLSHDYENRYTKRHLMNGYKIAFPTSEVHVDESRASHPAFMYRDLEQTRWEAPILNPQANLELQFANQLNTRILAKDGFRQLR
jgi:hypothetical protein